MDVGDFLDLDWQDLVPASMAATQEEPPSSQTANGSSPYLLPAQNNAQYPFNSPSAIVHSWDKEVHSHEIYPSTFPLNLVQTNYLDSSSPISLAPDFVTDGQNSSVPLQQGPYPYRTSAPQPSLAGHNTPVHTAIDLSNDGTNCTLQNELIDALTTSTNPPPASPSNHSHDLTPQSYQEQAHLGTGHLPSNPPSTPNRTTAIPSSASTPPSPPPSRNGDDLRHVSIDATCTTEQLGKIMQSLVGLAESMTVRVKA